MNSTERHVTIVTYTCEYMMQDQVKIIAQASASVYSIIYYFVQYYTLYRLVAYMKPTYIIDYYYCI